MLQCVLQLSVGGETLEFGGYFALRVCYKGPWLAQEAPLIHRRGYSGIVGVALHLLGIVVDLDVDKARVVAVSFLDVFVPPR